MKHAHTLITAILVGAMIGAGGVLFFQPTPDPSGIIAGPARVIDGDTIDVGGRV